MWSKIATYLALGKKILYLHYENAILSDIQAGLGIFVFVPCRALVIPIFFAALIQTSFIAIGGLFSTHFFDVIFETVSL